MRTLSKRPLFRKAMAIPLKQVGWGARAKKKRRNKKKKKVNISIVKEGKARTQSGWQKRPKRRVPGNCATLAQKVTSLKS